MSQLRGSGVAVAIAATHVRGWRRRHRVLGHVGLALARVSRFKSWITAG